MEWLKEFIKSIAAGIMISIGCVANMSCSNQYVGAVLFCIGLITILLFDFNLYTGKVCYIPDNHPKYILKTIVILIGNIIGCGVVGIINPVASNSICLTKLAYTETTVLAKSIMCGFLIYIAVDSYKRHNTLIPIIFCVPVFILSGHIHVIADTFYFISADMYNIEAVKYIILAAIGNAIGGMIFPFIYKVRLM